MTEIGVVIQGPTTYYKEIVSSYGHLDNVLWVTWIGEPVEHLEFIKDNGIEVLQLEMPLNKGYWNINLQCLSTFEGVKWLSSRGIHVKFIFKIRSDMVIDFNKLYKTNSELISNLKTDLVFLGYVKNGTEDYVLDYIVGGKVEPLLEFWRPSEDKAFGLPFPEEHLQQRYFNCNPILSAHKPLFLNLNGVGIHWLKFDANLKWYRSQIHLNTSFSNHIRCLLEYKEKLILFLKKNKYDFKK